MVFNSRQAPRFRGGRGGPFSPIPPHLYLPAGRAGETIGYDCQGGDMTRTARDKHDQPVIHPSQRGPAGCGEHRRARRPTVGFDQVDISRSQPDAFRRYCGPVLGVDDDGLAAIKQHGESAGVPGVPSARITSAGRQTDHLLHLRRCHPQVHRTNGLATSWAWNSARSAVRSKSPTMRTIQPYSEAMTPMIATRNNVRTLHSSPVIWTTSRYPAAAAAARPTANSVRRDATADARGIKYNANRASFGLRSKTSAVVMRATSTNGHTSRHWVRLDFTVSPGRRGRQAVA